MAKTCCNLRMNVMSEMFFENINSGIQFNNKQNK